MDGDYKKSISGLTQGYANLYGGGCLGEVWAYSGYTGFRGFCMTEEEKRRRDELRNREYQKKWLKRHEDWKKHGHREEEQLSLGITDEEESS